MVGEGVLEGLFQEGLHVDGIKLVGVTVVEPDEFNPLSDEPVERLGLDPSGVGFFEDRPVGNDLEKSRSMNPAEKTFPPVYPFIDWLSKIIVRKEIQGYYPLSLYFISYICIIF